jgi:hypothetical protein
MCLHDEDRHYLFLILIYGLFDDSFSRSDHTVSNDRTTTRQEIVRNVDWVTVESEVSSQYMPNWGEGGDQEHLSPNQDLNPGNLEHKIVVLTTIFNANTVVPQSHGPCERRSGLNHPQFCNILKKKAKV